MTKHFSALHSLDIACEMEALNRVNGWRSSSSVKRTIMAWRQRFCQRIVVRLAVMMDIYLF